MEYPLKKEMAEGPCKECPYRYVPDHNHEYDNNLCFRSGGPDRCDRESHETYET